MSTARIVVVVMLETQFVVLISILAVVDHPGWFIWYKQVYINQLLLLSDPESYCVAHHGYLSKACETTIQFQA